MTRVGQTIRLLCSGFCNKLTELRPEPYYKLAASFPRVPENTGLAPPTESEEPMKRVKRSVPVENLTG